MNIKEVTIHINETDDRNEVDRNILNIQSNITLSNWSEKDFLNEEVLFWWVNFYLFSVQSFSVRTFNSDTACLVRMLNYFYDKIV